MISFAPKGAWGGERADCPTARAVGYDLSPALRAYRLADDDIKAAIEFAKQSVKATGLASLRD